MALGEFSNKVRRAVGIESTLEPRIGLRPVFTIIDIRDVQSVVEQLSRQHAAGASAKLVGTTGSQFAVPWQEGGSGKPTQFAIISSIGDGTQPFVDVRLLRLSDTDPWDGKWELLEDEPAKTVSTEPNMRGRDYRQWLLTDNQWGEGRPYVRLVESVEGVIVAERVLPIRARSVSRIANLRRNECGFPQ